VIQAPKPELQIMRYELTDYEWAAIKPFLPNKPRGVPRVNDRRATCRRTFAHTLPATLVTRI
jgi:transposase